MPGSTATADAVLAQPGLQLTSLLTTNEVGVLSGHAKLTYLAILGLVFGLLSGTVTQTRGAVYLQQPPYGTNTQCYNQSYCGCPGLTNWMCIYVPCSVAGQKAHDGFPALARVEVCIWMGYFNFFG